MGRETCAMELLFPEWGQDMSLTARTDRFLLGLDVFLKIQDSLPYWANTDIQKHVSGVCRLQMVRG